MKRPQQLPGSLNVLVLGEQVVQNPERRLQVQVDNICGSKGEILDLHCVFPHLSWQGQKSPHL